MQISLTLVRRSTETTGLGKFLDLITINLVGPCRPIYFGWHVHTTCIDGQAFQAPPDEQSQVSSVGVDRNGDSRLRFRPLGWLKSLNAKIYVMNYEDYLTKKYSGK